MLRVTKNRKLWKAMFLHVMNNKSKKKQKHNEERRLRKIDTYMRWAEGHTLNLGNNFV